jgi:acyl-ACP thioesterase
MNTLQQIWREAFTVRAHEMDAAGVAAPARLCDYLQEAAGNHAHHLGFDIATLRQRGFTWMLTRLRVRLTRLPAWREAITIETWPSGTRGRLIATREFIGRDAAGAELLRATSDWLYVEVATRRICRVPEALMPCVPQGHPHALPPDDARPPDLETPTWSVTLPVRRSDLDLNQHVNNVRYVEWMMEPIPTTFTDTHQVAELEILFRQGAELGDTAVSHAAPVDDNAILHRIVRTSDNAVLVIARTRWSERTA